MGVIVASLLEVKINWIILNTLVISKLFQLISYKSQDANREDSFMHSLVSNF